MKVCTLPSKKIMPATKTLPPVKNIINNALILKEVLWFAFLSHDLTLQLCGFPKN